MDFIGFELEGSTRKAMK